MPRDERFQPNRKLKLSLVTETFPPEINGVAMTLSHLVGGLCTRGHAVTVVRPRQGKGDIPVSTPWREYLCPGIPIPGYPQLRAGLPVRGRLLRQWRADPPDLVHIATEGPLGYAALSAAHRLGLPISSSFHTNFHQYLRDYGFGALARPALAYLRHFHNRTRITLSPTATLNADLTRDGFHNVRLLARGVDTQFFSPERRNADLRVSWGAGPRDLVVVHVSRLAPEKNYPLLLKAFARIRAHEPNARFVIASDGPLRRKLQASHPWIQFTGFLSRPALAEVYASGDLFLFASLSETFGNVVTEAMSSGLSVVAFDYAAAARYLRHKESGWLIPPGNETSFLDAAQHLAASPETRARFGRQARFAALELPWDRVITGFERDLLEAAGIPSPAALAV